MPAEQRGLASAIKILFDPFELNVAERSLKKAGEVIPLGARAFDILITLVDRAGEVVSKSELIAKVWPDVTVEEGTLRVHLSALRKALGDGESERKFITNVQGRGYCFVMPVTRQTVSGPYRGFSQAKTAFDGKLSDVAPWVIHDLRRTARSLMSRAGVRPDIAERVMGHAIAGVEGIYDRHSYREEKADALRRLAALVDDIVNPRENIVAIRKQKTSP